jgi:Ca2+-transporting ATPase
VDIAALDGMPPEELAALAQRAHVFARISPAQKLQIIRGLQQAGVVVAMVGDGINDSPALRAADVGIVMGRGGADAARDVADMVLEGDELLGIAAALERGRTTYGNVRKAIRFLLATNLSELVVTLAAAALGIGTPLTTLQLLWINLLSDVLPALALALEPAHGDVWEEPPRDAREPIVRRGDLEGLARDGALMAGGCLGAYAYGMLRHGRTPRASTVSFTALVGAQLLYALSCRSRREGLFTGGRLPPNRPLAAALLGSTGLQVAVLALPPLRRLMGLGTIDGMDAVVALAGALLPFGLVEALKLAGTPASTLPRHPGFRACE